VAQLFANEAATGVGPVKKIIAHCGIGNIQISPVFPLICQIWRIMTVDDFLIKNWKQVGVLCK